MDFSLEKWKNSSTIDDNLWFYCESQSWNVCVRYACIRPLLVHSFAFIGHEFRTEFGFFFASFVWSNTHHNFERRNIRKASKHFKRQQMFRPYNLAANKYSNENYFLAFEMSARVLYCWWTPTEWTYWERPAKKNIESKSKQSTADEMNSNRSKQYKYSFDVFELQLVWREQWRTSFGGNREFNRAAQNVYKTVILSWILRFYALQPNQIQHSCCEAIRIVKICESQNQSNKFLLRLSYFDKTNEHCFETRTLNLLRLISRGRDRQRE